MKTRLLRIVCALVGHRFTETHFDGRGRRISVTGCERCGHVDLDRTKIVPRNRRMRRQYARAVAREIAR